MTRVLKVGAAQLGPIQKEEKRKEVVQRLIALLQEGASQSCDLVVFPELALTTFFPRWWSEKIAEFDHYFEKEMPSKEYNHSSMRQRNWVLDSIWVMRK